jgi:hypothetical protein
MIIKNKIYNLEELKLIYPDYYNRIMLNNKFSIEVKDIIRHNIISSFEDFSDNDKQMLLLLKESVFNNQDIYIFGSRISGKYIDTDEYNKYKELYSSIKESDWDIQSLYIPDKDSLKKFEKDFNIRIDFHKGTHKIKI